MVPQKLSIIPIQIINTSYNRQDREGEQDVATMSSELKITVQLVATHNDASSSHTSIDLTTLFTLICLNMEKKLPFFS